MLNDEMQPLSGLDVVEALWPLNDMFRARLGEIGRLPYAAAFESEADAAIIAYSKSPDSGPWKTMSLGAWRVLLERHQQMIVVALANERARNPVTSLPPGLDAADRCTALMLLLLLRMKLPFPVADRSGLKLPNRPQAKGH